MADKYVSILTGSNGNAGTMGSPYQTTSYAISQMVNGDKLWLKRGEDFPPIDYMSKQINLGSWGTGAEPTMSGFITCSGWTNEGSGMYSFTDAGLPDLVNVVRVNGSFQPRVRFAKNGYRTIASHTGTNYGTITDPTLSGSPSLVGAELVIRKRHWVIDRALVTGHSGTTLTYGNLDARHGLVYTPIDGYGYFIQNHTSVMTEVGDWKYDKATRKLTMYFGGGTPGSYIVQIAKPARIMHTGDSGGGTYEDIHFTGANQFAFSSVAAGTIFNRCKFTFCGEYALYTNNINSLQFNECTFEDMPNSAIAGDGGCNSWITDKNTFRRIGHWHGAGRSNDPTGQGIYIQGTSTTCTRNQFYNIGYEPIYLRGNGFVMDENYVDTFGYVKDDGGGLYTFEGTTVTNSNMRYCRNNTIKNGIGAGYGTADGEDKAFGIYWDEKASQITSSGNHIENCNKAIFTHNARYVSFSGGSLYNNTAGVHIRTYDTGEPSVSVDLDSMTIVGTSAQKLVIHDSAGSSNTSWGNCNNHKYYSDASTPFTTRINEGSAVNQSFANWKTTTGKDGASTMSAYPNVLVKTNNTDAPVVETLPGIYTDSAGGTYNGTVTVPARRTKMLFYVSSLNVQYVQDAGKFVIFNGKMVMFEVIDYIDDGAIDEGYVQ